MTRVEQLLAQRRARQNLASLIEGVDVACLHASLGHAGVGVLRESDPRLAMVHALGASRLEHQAGRTSRYYATDRAIADAEDRHRPSLQRFRGSYIVVNDEFRVLVTVVHDGKDSR